MSIAEGSVEADVGELASSHVLLLRRYVGEDYAAGWQACGQWKETIRDERVIEIASSFFF